MSQFGVDVKGTEAVIKGIGGLGLKPAETQELLRSLAEQQAVNIKDGLMEQTDVSGKTLVQSARAKREHGQTLVDKGHMMGAVREIRATPKEAATGLGALLENLKAYAHQFGSRGLPKREWLGFRKGDSEKLDKVIARFVSKKFGGG